ncbi:MAG: HIT family protein, partial [Candidatus Izemoplasmatales bacterium]
IDEEVDCKVFSTVPKIANAIKKAFNPIGLTVLINTDKPLQTIYHFHIHLIPRYPSDGVEIDFINNMGNTSKQQYLDTQEKIKACF